VDPCTEPELSNVLVSPVVCGELLVLVVVVVVVWEDEGAKPPLTVGTTPSDWLVKDTSPVVPVVVEVEVVVVVMLLTTGPEVAPVMFATLGTEPVIVLVTIVPLSTGTVSTPNCRSADP
jgi:hypothetical protein